MALSPAFRKMYFSAGTVSLASSESELIVQEWGGKNDPTPSELG